MSIFWFYLNRFALFNCFNKVLRFRFLINFPSVSTTTDTYLIAADGRKISFYSNSVVFISKFFDIFCSHLTVDFNLVFICFIQPFADFLSLKFFSTIIKVVCNCFLNIFVHHFICLYDFLCILLISRIFIAVIFFYINGFIHI